MSSDARFLFDPADVTTTLREFPNLRARLADPHREGEPSNAFARARKTARQIYRVLASNHYAHLQHLLAVIDRCLAQGFDQRLISVTRGREAFGSALAELAVADHLLGRGFTVQPLDLSKGAGAVPEMVAERGQLSVAVEVYAPRQWAGLTRLTDELNEQVKNADVPFDFHFSIDLDPIERFGPDGQLLYADPAALSRALIRQRR